MFFSGCRSVCRLHNAVTTINVALFSADANKNSGISKKNRRISCPCPLPKPKRNGCAPVPHVAAACGALLKRRDGTFRRFRRPFGRAPGCPTFPPGVSRARPRAPEGQSLSFLPCLSSALASPFPRVKKPNQAPTQAPTNARFRAGGKAPRAVFESDCAATIFGCSVRRDRM